MRILKRILNALSAIYAFIKPFKDERLNLIVFSSLILVLIYLIRILDLSYFNRDFWINLVSRQFYGKIKISPPRGDILDRNGTILAASEKVVSFYLRPAYAKDKELLERIILRDKKILKAFSEKKHVPLKKLLETLSPLSSIGKQDIERAFRKKFIVIKKNGRTFKISFVWLKKRVSVSPERAAKAVSAALKIYYSISKDNPYGKPYPDLLGFTAEFKRVYPYSVGSTVVGITSPYGEGISGLEYYLEKKDLIVGRTVELTGEKDYRGRVYLGERATVFVTREKGENVKLTIDGNVQYVVEKIISHYGKKWHPKLINAVLMDVTNGDVIAAASWPFYDYDNPKKKNPLTPRYAVCPYEPGSVMKPFVLAAAINEGLVTPNTVFKCPATLKIDDKVFKNEFHGRNVKLRAWEIIKYSDNVGIIQVAELLGKEKLYEYYRKFGFGRKTGIELPGESPGILRNWKKWRDVDFATLSFGHNISVTTLQLAAAYAALVNGGIYYKPRLLKAIVDDRGRVLKAFLAVPLRRVISEETSEEMRRVLTMVVEGGTGTGTKFKNFYVGGKTGTAQRYNPKLHGYDKTKINATFAGFFPATNPKYVLVVTVIEPKVPKDMLWASKIAVPIFRDIAERVLLYERIPPDKKRYFLDGNGNFQVEDINQNFPFKNGLQQEK